MKSGAIFEILKTEFPIEEALVQKNGVEVAPEKSIENNISEKVILKEYQNPTKTDAVKTNKKESIVIATVDDFSIKSLEKSILEESKILKRDPNSAIKINADDLLFAVTHSPKEVSAYYAKYNVNRNDVLRTIKSELKKSNFKIDPNTILAEVERTIDDDIFQNNFMNSLKRKVSDIAEAIASRND